jgi:hypothetical protein
MAWKIARTTKVHELESKKGPTFVGPCYLVAGVGFEPTTFRL